MSKPLSFGHIEVGLTVGVTGVGSEIQPETPLRIALLGAWNGQAGRGAQASSPSLADRTLVAVDRDNFDEVLAKFRVEIHVPFAEDGHTPITVRLAALDDFHPDRLTERVEMLRVLKELRARLNNPSTFSAAADELRAWVPANTMAKVTEQNTKREPPPSIPSDVNQQGLLDLILGETQSRSRPTGHPARAEGWFDYLQKVIEPHLLPSIDYSQQAQLLGLVDTVLSRQVRAILHNPDFQAAEAVWRGLFFLVRRLETSGTLQLHLLDVSKAELAADLGSADDLRSTQTYRLLVEHSIGVLGGQPWGILVGNYTFDNGRQDVELMGRIAKVACQAGAPFLAAASPRVVGCESLAVTPDPDDWRRRATPEEDEAWAALRRLPEASYLGLALPRFLLRLPYGKETDPVEGFDFEEMPEGPDHEKYLWGNPALACVYLLAEAFNQYGWEFRPGVIQEIDGLPLHVYREAGDSQMKPCAEGWLTHRAAEAILAKGPMPLQSVKGRAAVCLPRFQSLASPAKSLAGRWHS
jgi:type VI secretion system protein ImpC